MRLGSRNLRFWTSAKNMTLIKTKKHGEVVNQGDVVYIFRAKRLRHDPVIKYHFW